MHFRNAIKRFYSKTFSKYNSHKKQEKIYVISDTHFGHANILAYCKRPFKNIKDMNQELIRRWNRKVNNNDIVYFLGDFVFRGNTGFWKSLLNGKKIFIRGNHDEGLRESVHNKIIEYNGYRFYLVHNPYEIPQDWKGWTIYGHKHNNDLTKFPFIDGQRKRINVSVEVIDYSPISLDYLISLNLPAIKRKKTIHSAAEYW